MAEAVTSGDGAQDDARHRRERAVAVSANIHVDDVEAAMLEDMGAHDEWDEQIEYSGHVHTPYWIIRYDPDFGKEFMVGAVHCVIGTCI
jgi:hypothetical protein